MLHPVPTSSEVTGCVPSSWSRDGMPNLSFLKTLTLPGHLCISQGVTCHSVTVSCHVSQVTVSCHMSHVTVSQCHVSQCHVTVSQVTVSCHMSRHRSQYHVTVSVSQVIVSLHGATCHSVAVQFCVARRCLGCLETPNHSEADLKTIYSSLRQWMTSFTDEGNRKLLKRLKDRLHCGLVFQAT